MSSSRLVKVVTKCVNLLESCIEEKKLLEATRILDVLHDLNRFDTWLSTSSKYTFIIELSLIFSSNFYDLI